MNAARLLSLVFFVATCQLGAQSPTGVDVTFVAYNLENYLSMDRRDESGAELKNAMKPDADIEVQIGIISKLNPDILGVCEIGTMADFLDLRARLKISGLDYPHFEYSGGGDPTRHLGLLSRYPIVGRNSQSQLSYELNGALERFQRGILDATVEIPKAGRLRLLGLHLKSKREVDQGQALMRRNEAILTRKHLDEIFTKHPDVRLMVYGDLNDTRNEPAIQEIMGPRGTPGALTDIQLQDSEGERWTHYWRFADVYSRIDFILCSKTLFPLVDQKNSFIDRPENWRESSDHRPLVARFHFPLAE